jgi:Protein of unknown function (DUF3592)
VWPTLWLSARLIVAGAIAVALSILWSTWVDSGAQHILAGGASTTATVTSVQPSGCTPATTPGLASICYSGEIRVTYLAGGVRRRAQIRSGKGTYEAGSQVAVFYDPRQPDHAVLPDDPAPDGAWATPINAVGNIGLLVIGASIVVPVVRLVRAWRRRRVASRPVGP